MGILKHLYYKLLNKKYELISETCEYLGHTLHRIKALKDFEDVKKGDLGGWIESENNLSQEGDCWIYNEAEVFDKARVYGDARVYDEARVYDWAKVYDEAWVKDKARVYGEAEVYDVAEVGGNARVKEEAKVCDEAMVYGEAVVRGKARVGGMAEVYGWAEVGYATITKTICGNTEIFTPRYFSVLWYLRE